MKRVLAGIALAVTGVIASATLVTAANATTWDNPNYKTFTNWGECDYYGQQFVAQHRISSYACTSFTGMPGGASAYMSVDF